jgi:rhodanese-related sulfurtransferase
MEKNLNEILRLLLRKVENLENNFLKLEEKMDISLSIQKNHLIRVKNHEEIADSMILHSRPYNDLSPQSAFQIYQSSEHIFIFLDVSKNTFHHEYGNLDGTIYIALEELKERLHEFKSKTIPILIISEDGLRSILACEIFVKHGHYNVNNVSGGYLYWPGNKKMNENNVVEINKKIKSSGNIDENSSNSTERRNDRYKEVY